MSLNAATLENVPRRNRALERATSSALPALAVGDVTAPVIYAEPGDVRPRVLTSALTGKAPDYGGSYTTQPVTIHDARPGAFWLSLEREGLELHRDEAPAIDLYDDRAVEAQYYPSVRKLIREATGAASVHVFDHTRRIAHEGAGVAEGSRGPARHVHNDYTPRSAAERIEAVLAELDPEEADALRGRRVAQINHWRPIVGPVVRMPLGVIDAETVDEEDLVATDLVYPDRVGEIYHVAANANHRWLYVSRMQPDEVLLIKGYDTLADGRARFTPHGAFAHPDTPADAPARESIEVRTLAFF